MQGEAATLWQASSTCKPAHSQGGRSGGCLLAPDRLAAPWHREQRIQGWGCRSEAHPHFQVCKCRLCYQGQRGLSGGMVTASVVTTHKAEEESAYTVPKRRSGGRGKGLGLPVASVLFHVSCHSCGAYPQAAWSQELCESELGALVNNISTLGFSQFQSPGAKPWPLPQVGPGLSRSSVHMTWALRIGGEGHMYQLSGNGLWLTLRLSESNS